MPAVPHQYEFARLNITYTVLSKRFLTTLVRERHVSGWDDPRMPTLAGQRRRGVPAAALREFVRRVGVARPTASSIWHVRARHPRGAERRRAAPHGGAAAAASW